MEFEEKVALIAYKELSEITDDDWTLLGIEKNRCQAFTHFLKYCNILRAPTQQQAGGLIPFQLLPHVKAIIRHYMTHRLVSILKARQIYVSTITAAYVLWHTLFNRGSTWEFFSEGQDTAAELLGKAQRIYAHLPPFLKIKAEPNSTEKMGFPSMGSRIMTFGSTESAGISFTCSGIVWDEHEEHPYAASNFDAAKPSIDSVGGQAISIFTVNKRKPHTLAKSIFRNGKIFCWDKQKELFVPEPEGKWGTSNNGFTSLFFPFDVIPGRDEEWYEDTKRALTADELQGLTPELHMEQAYPRSLEEALRPTSTVSAFSQDALAAMMGDCDRARIDIEGLDSGIIHIYKPFNIGEFYIAATDTSHGLGKDFSVTAVMNVKTGEVVADICDNRIGPDELAYQSIELLGHYRNPLWYIESNDVGASTILSAQNIGYKNFGYKDANRTRIGFDTQGGKDGTRSRLWWALIPAINNRQIRIFNPIGVKQFYDVIKNAEREGRIEAMKGGHDDYPMAVGICWLKKDEVHTEWNSEPIKTLTFSHGRR